MSEVLLRAEPQVAQGTGKFRQDDKTGAKGSAVPPKKLTTTPSLGIWELFNKLPSLTSPLQAAPPTTADCLKALRDASLKKETDPKELVQVKLLIEKALQNTKLKVEEKEELIKAQKLVTKMIEALASTQAQQIKDLTAANHGQAEKNAGLAKELSALTETMKAFNSALALVGTNQKSQTDALNTAKSNLEKSINELKEAIRKQGETNNGQAQTNAGFTTNLKGLTESLTNMKNALEALKLSVGDNKTSQTTDLKKAKADLEQAIKDLALKLTEELKKDATAKVTDLEGRTNQKIDSSVKGLEKKIADLTADFNKKLACMDQKNTEALTALKADYDAKLLALNEALKASEARQAEINLALQQQVSLFDSKAGVQNAVTGILQDMKAGLQASKGSFDINPESNDIKAAVAALKKSTPLEEADYDALAKIGISKDIYQKKYQKDGRGRSLFADLLTKLQGANVGIFGPRKQAGQYNQVQAQDLSAFLEAGKMPPTKPVLSHLQRVEQPNGKPAYIEVNKDVPTTNPNFPEEGQKIKVQGKVSTRGEYIVDQRTHLLEALAEGRVGVGAK